MSDDDKDLIEALRLQGWDDAADLIEELELERDYIDGTNDVLIAENQRLEAKLSKAVEALRFYAPQTVGGITFLGGDDAGKRAADVLAELTGET